MYTSLFDKKRLDILKSCLGEEKLSNFLMLWDAFNPIVSPETEKIINLFSKMDTVHTDDFVLYERYSVDSRSVNVINTVQGLEQCINDIYAEGKNILGFDSEQKAIFRKGQRQNPISIVQLATETNCYIIQVKYIAQRDSLLELLKDSDIIKLGIGIRNDRSEIFSTFRIRPRSLIDLSSILMKKYSAKNRLGAKSLSLIFLKKTLEKRKSVSLSNWENAILTEQQIKYVAEDACIPLDVLNSLIFDYPEMLLLLPATIYEKIEHKYQLKKQ